jgi:hypothetical protein
MKDLQWRFLHFHKTLFLWIFDWLEERRFKIILFIWLSYPTLKISFSLGGG